MGAVVSARTPWLPPRYRRRVWWLYGLGWICVYSLGYFVSSASDTHVTVPDWYGILFTGMALSGCVGVLLTGPSDNSDRKVLLQATSVWGSLWGTWQEFCRLRQLPRVDAELTEQTRVTMETLALQLGELWYLAHAEAGLVETPDDIAVQEQAWLRQRLAALSALAIAQQRARETEEFLAANARLGSER